MSSPTRMPKTMGLSSGTRLGPYQIVALLGAGGMGEVYRARDSRLERDVAIKVLPPRLTESPQARERFQREARAVAALQHPNICTIHDVGETGDGHAFLVMELLQGQTLQQRLGRGALDIASLVDLGALLADALDAAHRAGIVHRDIKPANIFLTERGPKILDFGLAKAAPRPAGDVSRDLTTADAGMLTEEGTTVGTLAYMSPEQLRGEPVDAGTDLFSFGAVLYEMATATPAFPGATNAVISAAILHETPLPPRTLRADLPGPLNDIILKALEKDRQLRYQHASDLRADLRRYDRDTTASRAAGDGRSTAGPRPSRRAAWKVWAPAAAVIVLAIAGAAGYVYAHRAPKLTDKDTIVLADFVNTTGDPVFDGTLRQGLSIQLQQSPFLSLVPDGRIRKTLGLMGRPADTRLTPEVAREVCERIGSTAVLEGSIASLGSQYVVGLRAKNCRTGDILDEQQAQAARKEDVLNVLSDAASTFRTRVGESLATVERHSKPLAEATTSSLDALRAFSTGFDALNVEGNGAFVPLLKRAVEIDPNFALAHSQLGLAYSALGEQILARQSTSRAYELRAHASDREQFFIAATYDRQVTGNLAKAADTFVLWTQTYPRDSAAHGLWSGFATQGVGKYETSIDEARKSIDLDPDSVFGYLNLAYCIRVSRSLSRKRADGAAGAGSKIRCARTQGAAVLPRLPEERRCRDGARGCRCEGQTWRRRPAGTLPRPAPRPVGTGRAGAEPVARCGRHRRAGGRARTRRALPIRRRRMGSLLRRCGGRETRCAGGSAACHAAGTWTTRRHSRSRLRATPRGHRNSPPSWTASFPKTRPCSSRICRRSVRWRLSTGTSPQRRSNFSRPLRRTIWRCRASRSTGSSADSIRRMFAARRIWR